MNEKRGFHLKILLIILSLASTLFADDCRVKYEGYESELVNPKTSRVDKMVKKILKKKRYKFNDQSNYEYELKIKNEVPYLCSQSEPGDAEIINTANFKASYSNAMIEKSNTIKYGLFPKSKVRKSLKKFVKSIPHCKQYKRSN